MPHGRFPLRLYNAAGRLRKRLGHERPLTIDAVIAGARFKTGMTEFGDESFFEPLERLIDSYEDTGRLSPFGRTIVLNNLVHYASNRLRIHDLVTRKPEILRQDIHRPLFVVGLPRTGTTLLHKLIAQDPSCRAPQGFETIWPVPLDKPSRSGRDPRIRFTHYLIWALNYVAPQLNVIHPMSAETVEETTLLMANSFVAPAFAMTAIITTYDSWLNGLSRAEGARSYQYLKRQLQVLQWQRSREHWVLKSPIHLKSLDSLLDVFPDACIVHTHRDPAKIVASACSLYDVMRGTYSDEVDRVALGRELVDDMVLSLDRASQVREVQPERFLDVHYRDLMQDQIGEVRRIYDYFGYHFGGATEAAMRDWVSTDRHQARHRYDLSDFGLTATQVAETFAEYQTKFKISPETAL